MRSCASDSIEELTPVVTEKVTEGHAAFMTGADLFPFRNTYEGKQRFELLREGPSCAIIQTLQKALSHFQAQ